MSSRRAAPRRRPRLPRGAPLPPAPAPTPHPPSRAWRARVPLQPYAPHRGARSASVQATAAQHRKHGQGRFEDMLAARSDPAFDSLDWQRAIAGALADARVDTVAYIPDARLRGIVSALDGPATRILTREEECIAFASGQLAVGRRAAVADAVLGPRQRAERARLAFDSVRADAAARALDARDARRGQPRPGADGRAPRRCWRRWASRCSTSTIPTPHRVDTAACCSLASGTGPGAAVLLDAPLGGGRERD